MNTHTINRFRRSLNLLGAIAISALPASTAVAQSGPAIAYPSSSWSFSDHASTYGEGVMRGQAAILNSAGELAYLDSLASINYQEAHRRAIENSVAYTKAYYDRREMQAEFLRRYGPKPFVGEARRKVIEYYKPKKLSADQFNADAGKITWPHVLRQQQYTPIRNEIDAVFASREFQNSGDGSDSQLKVKQLVKSMTALVRENLHSMSVEQYTDAQEFLRSLDAEAKIPVSPKPTQVANEPNAPAAAQPVKPDNT